MLFDTSSPKRKRVVRIVFGGLALIFAGSFVFLGIGSETGGGLADVFQGGNEDAAAEQFEQQIEDAEERVEADPTDSEALSELALLRAQSGAAQLDIDEQTGLPIGLTEESRSEFEAAITAWNRYVETDPRRIDTATATRVVEAYRFLGDAGGAAEAQRLLAESDPSTTTLAGLADLLYRDLQIEEADKVRDQALQRAKPDVKGVLKRQLDAIRRQATKVKADLDKQPDLPEGEAGELSDPFGGFGAGADPATPP